MNENINESLKEYWEKKDQQLEEDKRNYKGPHCCLIMDYCVDKSDPQNVSPIIYNSKFREYYLKATTGPGAGQIYFCPNCGVQLPQGLSILWFTILEKEYGLDDPGWPEQKEKMPTEFLTDEWWKNRNL